MSEIAVGPSNCASPARVFQSIHAFALALYDLTRDPCSAYGSIDHWFRVDAVGNVATWPARREQGEAWHRGQGQSGKMAHGSAFRPGNTEVVPGLAGTTVIDYAQGVIGNSALSSPCVAFGRWLELLLKPK